MKFKLFVNRLQIGNYDTRKELVASLNFVFETYDVQDLEVKRSHDFYVTVDEVLMGQED
jgi:hypothetical protein